MCLSCRHAMSTRMVWNFHPYSARPTPPPDQSHTRLPPFTHAVIREVFHEYGVPGFWNGCQASLVMVINPTLQYTLYERLAGVRAKLRAQQTGAGAGVGHA